MSETEITTPATFTIATLGCKVNHADSEALAATFIAQGLRPASEDASADVIVVNTCTVTHLGDRSSRQIISQERRTAPQAMIVATGCYAQVTPDKVAALPGVDLVVPNTAKASLASAVLDALQIHNPSDSQQQLTLDDEPTFPVADNDERLLADILGRTRAEIKVQDGCNNRCTYCIVPVARGASRSRPIADIVRLVQRKAAAGIQEVVLTGIHLGDYHPTTGTDFGDLLNALLTETEIPRIRVSSIEPEDFCVEWLAHWQNPRMCRHLHLPMQSGSDLILRKMARRYLTDHYRTIANAAYKAIPELALTTDIIVGFPGETEDDFQATYTMATDLNFAKMHIFRFSPRATTAAARMQGQISESIKRSRAQKLLALNTNMARAFRERYLNRVVRVLWESHRPWGWEGLTDNYLRVFMPATSLSNDLNLQHTQTWTRITAVTDDGAQGEFIDHPTNQTVTVKEL
jgi:threonylcarbamoyladenosine tRNA methylthiotransferase MtaB